MSLEYNPIPAARKLQSNLWKRQLLVAVRPILQEYATFKSGAKGLTSGSERMRAVMGIEFLGNLASGSQALFLCASSYPRRTRYIDVDVNSYLLGITNGGHNMRSTYSFSRKLTRSLIWVVTVALISFTRATADEPRPDDPSPKQILIRMAKAYADYNSYRDSGVVKTVFVKHNGKRTVEIPFTTAFVRPDKFRFEYKEKNGGMDSWSNGKDVQTW